MIRMKTIEKYLLLGLLAKNAFLTPAFEMASLLSECLCQTLAIYIFY